MAQTTWATSDIQRLAQAGEALAPTQDFADGIAWLAAALNAPIRKPTSQMIVPHRDVIEVTCEVYDNAAR